MNKGHRMMPASSHQGSCATLLQLPLEVLELVAAELTTAERWVALEHELGHPACQATGANHPPPARPAPRPPACRCLLLSASRGLWHIGRQHPPLLHAVKLHAATNRAAHLSALRWLSARRTGIRHLTLLPPSQPGWEHDAALAGAAHEQALALLACLGASATGPAQLVSLEWHVTAAARLGDLQLPHLRQLTLRWSGEGWTAPPLAFSDSFSGLATLEVLSLLGFRSIRLSPRCLPASLAAFSLPEPATVRGLPPALAAAAPGLQRLRLSVRGSCAGLEALTALRRLQLEEGQHDVPEQVTALRHLGALALHRAKWLTAEGTARLAPLAGTLTSLQLLGCWGTAQSVMRAASALPQLRVLSVAQCILDGALDEQLWRALPALQVGVAAGAGVVGACCFASGDWEGAACARVLCPNCFGQRMAFRICARADGSLSALPPMQELELCGNAPHVLPPSSPCAQQLERLTLDMRLAMESAACLRGLRALSLLTLKCLLDEKKLADLLEGHTEQFQWLQAPCALPPQTGRAVHGQGGPAEGALLLRAVLAAVSELVGQAVHVRLADTGTVHSDTTRGPW